MIPKEPELRLAYFCRLYEEAALAYLPTKEALRRHRRQYEGDPEIDGSEIPASSVRNITYELIEGQVSSDLPKPKVSPLIPTPEKERCALSIERLCSALIEELPFERLNDLDERNTTIYGASVFHVEWREGEGIAVDCLTPERFLPEPGVSELSLMDYCFLDCRISKEELFRRYGTLPRSAEGEEEETLPLTVCYYREDGRIGRFSFSRDTFLEDLPDLYAPLERVCGKCGATGECDCGSAKTFRKREEGRIPRYRPKRFPLVIRRNIVKEDSPIGQSDCEVIRPQQQAINKLESRILEKLMRSGVTPVMPEDARLSPDNTVFGQVLRLRAGESLSQYGTIDTTPSISEEVLQSDRLYEQARRILGVSDSFLGLTDPSASSGYAKQLQIDRAAGRLESKRRLKMAAYAELYRLFFELTLAFCEEGTEVPYRDREGRLKSHRFCRYDFLTYDPKADRYGFEDRFLFSSDKSGESLRREDVWERNLKNLASGTLGDPASKSTLLHYWQSQEKAHYPGAADHVAFFREQLTEEGAKEALLSAGAPLS